jgi:hypothetical protein
VITKHGHHIPDSGNEEEDAKARKALCGGIHHCKQCKADVEAYRESITADATKYAAAQQAALAESTPGDVDLVDWDIDANRPADSFPAEVIPAESDLEKELGHLLNSHSAENESGTPDFILAMYLTAQLELFNQTIKNRAAWRGEEVELPALISLRREDEQIAKTLEQVRTLIANGIVHINSEFEESDLYRHLRQGDEKEVPLVVYTNNQRNEIGTARVKVNPGEIVVTGTITGAVAQITDSMPDAAYSLAEPKDEPLPEDKSTVVDPGEIGNAFRRYQQKGLSE